MLPYFDTHCDTISECLRTGEALRKNNLCLDLERATSAYGPFAQFFSVWGRPVPPEGDVPGGTALGGLDFTKPDFPPEALYAKYQATLRLLREELAQNTDIATLCLSAADAEQAAAEGKAACFILVEGAEMMMCSEEKLREGYELGVRVLCMNWNYDNALSGASRGAVQGGLTEAGRRFVRTAQELGILLDMSHISDAAFWDIMEITTKPLIAGHSNARAVWDNPRNLTDEMYTALLKTGGVVGINFNPGFLGKDPTIDTVVAHIEHFCSLGGEKGVCLGGDLDGVASLPAGITEVRDMAKVYERLLQLNYNEDACRDIFYNNTLEAVRKGIS